MKAQNLIFSIDRCDSKVRDCKSNFEINNFLHDLQVDTWVI
jgi:hypothetical protein